MARFDADALPDEDEDFPRKKSRAPVIALGAAVLAVAGYLAFGGTSRLSKEELATFDEAQKTLRTDDYSQYGDAEKKLLAIVEKHPDNVEPAVWLAQLYCAWGEELGTESDSFRKATLAKGKEITDLKKTIETSKSKNARAAAQVKFDAAKTEVEALNKAGKLRDAASVEKLKAAKALVKQASNTDYGDAALHRAMADYARVSKKWPDVDTQLEYVRKHKPDSAGLRFVSGAMIMEKDKKPDEALALLEEALKIDPQFTRAQYFVGLAWDAKGDSKNAAEAMKKVLAMSPNHPGAKAYLGMVTTLEAARLAAAEAETAGTDKENVAAGDEVNPPAAAEAAPSKAAPRKGHK
jgi:tetratricopeptide (TPR) repeat protein